MRVSVRVARYDARRGPTVHDRFVRHAADVRATMIQPRAPACHLQAQSGGLHNHIDDVGKCGVLKRLSDEDL